ERAAGDLLIRRARVFEVEDQGIGPERPRLFDFPRSVGRHEQPRAAGSRIGNGHAAGAGYWRRIRAARLARTTTLPFWLMARCSKVTIPKPGRDFDRRTSRISVSACSVSP